MRISQNLPSFRKSRELFAVAGDRHADFYLAYERNIKKISSFDIREPEYTDRDGVSASRGSGRLTGTGSIYEQKNGYIQKKFQKQFADELKKIASVNRITGIHLFVPSYNKNLILKALPRNLEQLVNSITNGNYTARHPFELVELIELKQLDRHPTAGEPVHQERRARIKNALKKFRKLSASTT